MKNVVVVAGAIVDQAQQQVLIAKRPANVHQGNLWEFPGGKVESDESNQAALARELYEELGIVVKRSEPLMQIDHEYPDLSLHLDVWLVTQFSGEPTGREGQPVRWVAIEKLADYDFPAANSSIVLRLQSLGSS